MCQTQPRALPSCTFSQWHSAGLGASHPSFTPQVTGAEVASDNSFIRELVNTLPDAHGTFMAQAIGTCQVGTAAALALLAGTDHASCVAASRSRHVAARQPRGQAPCCLASSHACGHLAAW